ncbi:MAG TPA: DUF899 family protein [Fimbriimonadaceae bacterium]|nr:DUF899 family protein [Fimbriimonadaceae bacterium]
MSHIEADREIAKIHEEIDVLKKKLAEARSGRPPEPVRDYKFRTSKGTVNLSELFGDRNELLIIHNMGQGCVYCTLWADGLNGFTDHLENRAAFALVSPDEPAVAEAFAEGRGWRFKIFSSSGDTFTQDMGFWKEADGYWPGVSAFAKLEDGSIIRTGMAFFGPGDDFCAVWPMFDLLQGGVGKWEPQYSYR